MTTKTPANLHASGTQRLNVEMNNIVADGRERLLDEPETQKSIEEAIQLLTERHESALEEAGLLRKYWLRWRLKREITKAIENIAPRDGLYFSNSRAQNKKPL